MLFNMLSIERANEWSTDHASILLRTVRDDFGLIEKVRTSNVRLHQHCLESLKNISIHDHHLMRTVHFSKHLASCLQFDFCCSICCRLNTPMNGAQIMHRPNPAQFAIILLQLKSWWPHIFNRTRIDVSDGKMSNRDRVFFRNWFIGAFISRSIWIYADSKVLVGCGKFLQYLLSLPKILV